MPRLRIDKAFARRIRTLWKKNDLGKSFIGNPIESFKAYKFRAKAEGSNHATLDALMMSWRFRVMNGPELNILFLGMPFLVDFGVDYAMGKMQKPEKPQVVTNYVKKPAPQASHQVNNAGGVPMPRQAPYSDKAVPFYCELMNAGMSREAALAVVNGEYTQREAGDHLSEDDQRILLEVLAKYAPEQVAKLMPVDDQ